VSQPTEPKSELNRFILMLLTYEKRIKDSLRQMIFRVIDESLRNHHLITRSLAKRHPTERLKLT
jgi:hypothetical protein